MTGKLPRPGLAMALLALWAGAVGAAAQDASDDPQPPVDKTIAASTRLVTLIGTDYPLGRTCEALAAPSIAAPTLGRLAAGTTVHVVGVTEGWNWYQIELADKRLAYVETAAIPAAGPGIDGAPSAPGSVRTVAAPSADDGPALDLPPVTAFAAAHGVLGVVNPTAVYLAPDRRAPKAYPVGVGTEVEIIAKSGDGAWAWVTTADGAAAYIPMSDLAPPQNMAR
jgi:hypothetical protein